MTRALVMTPLKHGDAYGLSRMVQSWARALKWIRTPTGIDFCFAVPDGEEQLARQAVRFLGPRFAVWTLPVPHEALTRLFPELKADWERNRFGEIALYRNMLLDEARRVRPDMAIFLDSDVLPPKGFIEIFEEDKRDVCAGVVKTFNNDWTEVYGFGSFRTPFFSGLDWAPKVHEGHLAKYGFANTACLALGWRVLADERARFEPLTVDFQDQKVTLSEDHCFSKLLTDLGYEIYVDSRVRCEHERLTPQGLRWLRA